MKKIIILIILLFVFFLIINENKNKNKKEHMTNSNKWRNYRLGDILKGHIFL